MEENLLYEYIYEEPNLKGEMVLNYVSAYYLDFLTHRCLVIEFNGEIYDRINYPKIQKKWVEHHSLDRMEI